MPYYPPASAGGSVATDTIWDAKGDLVAATGADAATKLTVGANGTILVADSAQTNGIKWAAATGTSSFVYNETPSGTVNGSNAAFTTASAPVSGTLQVFRDGQLMAGGGADYSLSGSTITFTTAPATSSVLIVTYQSVASTAGNADTVDGFHAAATPTASQIPVLDSSAFLPVAAFPVLQGCKVYLSGDQSNIGTSAVKILFDSETYDVGGNFASYKYTVPSGKAGYYLITLNVYMYGSITDGSQQKAMIYVNGASIAENNMVAGGTNVGISPCITTVTYLAAGAYVEFYCQNTNTNADIYSSAIHTFGAVQQMTYS